jgi:tryptophan-rich sensory protein
VQNPIYFGLVWYTLYLFIATAVFLIFLERASLHEWVAYAEFSLFAVIVITIYAWTPLFFGLHDYLQGLATTKGKKNASSVPPSTAHLLAFIDLLMLLIALTCFMFFAIFGDPSYSTGYWIPALLMGPVIAWVTYAGYLNLAAMVVSQD